MGHGITIFGEYVYILGGITKKGEEKALVHTTERILVKDLLSNNGMWEEVDFKFDPHSNIPNDKFTVILPIIVPLKKRIMILGGRTVTLQEDGDFEISRENLDKTGFAFNPRKKEISLEIRT